MEKRLVILGGGESGVGAAILGLKEGYQVFVSDLSEIKQKYKDMLNQYHIEYEEKAHTESKILSADLIIKSPGIPEKAPIMKAIRNQNIEVVSEIEFAGRFSKAKKICITGSNGKTTTTLWIYHILKSAGLNVGLAGNVGNSFAFQVAEKDFEYYVIELSSFQLDDMFGFKADISILLNITPDHLDRYNYEFQNYIDSKFRITQNQTENEYFIYCADDPVIAKELEKRNLKMNLLPFSINKKLDSGAWLENDILKININENEFTMFANELALEGKHNTYNAMAAGIAAKLNEIRNEQVKKYFMDFEGVEHRLEKFIKVKGIQFINDSKATNVNSVWYALDCMNGKNVVLILGGQDKGNDYNELIDLVKDKVKAIVCMGIDNSKILKAFNGIVDLHDTHSIDAAVKTAYKIAKEGDVVLLSPACASFDLFDNYEDRGKKFKETVRNL